MQKPNGGKKILEKLIRKINADSKEVTVLITVPNITVYGHISKKLKLRKAKSGVYSREPAVNHLWSDAYRSDCRSYFIFSLGCQAIIQLGVQCFEKDSGGFSDIFYRRYTFISGREFDAFDCCV